jgi:D-sedoheptulose 7-phosphate isomerase
MQDYIQNFSGKVQLALERLPKKEIAKALNILQGVFERDGRIYVFGNGGSMAIASHWVSDFNKTVFSNYLEKHSRRFQAIRVPGTESEITAWANDAGYDMIFAGPLQNYLQDADVIIAISSSGNSPNVVKAVELARSRNVPVIGLSGFDQGNRLNELSDAKIHVPTEKGQYEIVESVHGTIMHLMAKYFKDYFDRLVEREA